MATWAEFEAAEPAIALDGARLLRPTGDGIAFLATVRGDGGPRVHPVMPVLAAGRLHVFVVNLSPKHEDLLRDGRYALHALPPATGGEEFYVTGRARAIEATARRAEVVAASGGRLGLHDFESLFELDLRRVLHTVWANWGTAETWPEYRKWRSRR
ncbi:MAG TPA: pyridoxamine 5'-phosphate oxidase family protein [Tepidiformaceae bacterium]|jgi:hypothetical protein|nr:pyridoxamine 5'-phosphate oxidase family protein [Tepidiformaceae bacterium]